MVLEVIIVDDDSVVTFLNEIIVKDSGFSPNPISFNDANDATEYMTGHNNGNTLYCVFLDINMPMISGWEFIEELDSLGLKESVAAIMVTSSLDEADRVKSENYDNVIGFLEKPISKAALESFKHHPKLKMFFQSEL